MSGLLRVAAPPRSRVLAGLAGLLASLPDPLFPLVEQVTGLEGEIDLVARNGRGRAVAVCVADPGEDLSALAGLLAQCDWLRPRLRDWLKLNPALGVRPELGAGGLLLAPAFEARTVAVARLVGEDDVALGRLSAFEWEGALQLAVEPLALGARRGSAVPAPATQELPPPSPGNPLAPRGENGDGRSHLALAEVGPGVAARGSRFRTGLADDELGLPRRPRSAPRG
jgi:hypothetical protein